jgi:hypothetical protein
VNAIQPAGRGDLVPSLDERRDRILAIVGAAAVDVGEELLAAKREHRGAFMEWVSTSLPFGIDKAERFMAIARAFSGADEAVRAALPPAWTAMFELARLPVGEIQRSIETGEIHPEMSVRDARKLVTGRDEAPELLPPRPTPGPAPGFDPNPRLGADILASELVRADRSTLSGPVEYLLRQWIGPDPG